MVSTRHDATQTRQQLRNYICSNDYMNGIARMDGLAMARMRARIAERDDHQLAVEDSNAEKLDTENLAIVLDIDETALSNLPQIFEGDIYGSEKNIACPRLTGHPDSNEAGCSHVTWQGLGQDLAIEPTLALYREARLHGVTVFFITGRSQRDYTNINSDKPILEITKTNLVKAGYDKGFCLFIKNQRSSDDSLNDCDAVAVDLKKDTSDTGAFKRDIRNAIQQAHYTIIVNVGDQLNDLSGAPYDGEEPAEATFLLPNPFY